MRPRKPNTNNVCSSLPHCFQNRQQNTKHNNKVTHKQMLFLESDNGFLSNGLRAVKLRRKPFYCPSFFLPIKRGRTRFRCLQIVSEPSHFTSVTHFNVLAFDTMKYFPADVGVSRFIPLHANLGWAARFIHEWTVASPFISIGFYIYYRSLKLLPMMLT